MNERGATPLERIDVLLTLRGEGRLLLGRDRVALLEAVIAHGNMTRAAKEAGFSYKAAWDAVQGINALLPRPAFVTRGGGRRGGAAEATPEGRRYIAVFRQLEERLSRAVNVMAAEGVEAAGDALLWRAGQLSARNAFHRRVEGLEGDAVEVMVTLVAAGRAPIRALVTRRAAQDLKLAPGCAAVALINAGSIRLLAPGGESAAGDDNLLRGETLARVDGARRSEIELDLGEGEKLVAMVGKDAADALDARKGLSLEAVFHPAEVVLAAE